MEKFEPIDIDFVINNGEVKASTAKVKDDLKSVGQTAEETAAKVNNQLKGAFARPDNAGAINEINKGLKEQSAIIQRGKPAYNGLGNSINQISREMSAFTVSAQTGFLAISNNLPILADEINRLKAKNIELTASGQKAVPVWQQVIKGLFSWQTALSVGITLLTIYGKEVVTWIGTLFKGKEAIDELKQSQDALNKTFDSGSYQKVIKDVLQLRSYINLAKQGVIDKDVALQKYNDTLGKASGEVNSLAEAEQGVIDKAPAYVEAMLYKSAAAAASAEAAKKLAESAKRQNEIEEEIIEIQNRKAKPVAGGFNPNSPGSVNVSGLKQQSDLKKANEDINALLEERKKLNESSLNVVTKLNEEAAKIAKDAGLDIFGTTNDDKKTKIVSEYQKLLDKLSELDKEYSRKSFTKDEEELQALRDKFDKIRTLVERFNADPKNKAQIIDLSNLDQLQVKAEASLTYRQTTEKLKDELAEQQKLFAEFETYKSQFGIAAAKKEFEGRIGEATTYYDFLKQKQQENAESYTAVQEGTAIGGEIERVQLINKALSNEATKQKKLFNEQLVALQNYQTKRNLLIEKYEAKRVELVNKGKADEVAELDKQHQEELDSLDDANIKKLKSYTQLFDGVKNLSIKEAKVIIANAKALVKVQNISAELKAKILKQIAETEQLISNSQLDDIFQYANAIGNLGSALSGLGNDIGNAALANAGSILGSLAGGVQNVLGAFAKGATTGDIIGGAVGGLTTLLGLFGKAAQARQRAREIDEAYYLSVLAFQNQYNLSIAEQIRLQSILAENVFINDSSGRIKDALKSIDFIKDEYAGALDELRNTAEFDIKAKLKLEGYDVGSYFKYLRSLMEATDKGISFDVFENYPDLIQTSKEGVESINVALAENLVANKLVNKETAQILNNILDWQTALEDARQQIKEVITDLTGGLASDLRNDLVDAFTAGEDAAIRMGDTVDSVLENIIGNLLFNSVFQNAFSDLEAQMAASFDVGGDNSWIDDFGRFFSEASGLTDDFNNALAAAQQEAASFGFDVFKPDSEAQKQGLTGAIRRELTESTGGELAGLFRGQYDVTRRLLEATEIYYEKENRHQANLIDLISINTKIETNTASTVLELQTAVVELKKIADNTEKIYINDLG